MKKQLPRYSYSTENYFFVLIHVGISDTAMKIIAISAMILNNVVGSLIYLLSPWETTEEKKRYIGALCQKHIFDFWKNVTWIMLRMYGFLCIYSDTKAASIKISFFSEK